jgi:hypothetical protein
MMVGVGVHCDISIYTYIVPQFGHPFHSFSLFLKCHHQVSVFHIHKCVGSTSAMSLFLPSPLSMACSTLLSFTDLLRIVRSIQ